MFRRSSLAFNPLIAAAAAVVISAAALPQLAEAQAQFHIPGNQRTDVVEVRDGDRATAFMSTDTRYFCFGYQVGALNSQVNAVQFDAAQVESGGGTPATVRQLGLIPTFENNPSQFLNVRANEAGFQTLPLQVLSADPLLPQSANVQLACCGTEGRGKYNTIATPFNFLELINAYGGGSIEAVVELYSFAQPGVPIAQTSVSVPANGRVDVSVHDLLLSAGKSSEFGTIKVVHDGPAGLFDAFLSFYESDLTLRETLPLSFPRCGV